MRNPLIKPRRFIGKIRDIIEKYNSFDFPKNYYFNSKTIKLADKFVSYLEQNDCKFIGSGSCSWAFKIDKNWVIKLTQPEPNEKIDFSCYNLGLEYYLFNFEGDLSEKEKSIYGEIKEMYLKCIVPVSYMAPNYKMCIQKFIVKREGYPKYCRNMRRKYKLGAQREFLLPFVNSDYNVIFDGKYPRLIDLF